MTAIAGVPVHVLSHVWQLKTLVATLYDFAECYPDSPFRPTIHRLPCPCAITWTPPWSEVLDPEISGNWMMLFCSV